MVNADAKARCRLSGGRLMRLNSLYDIRMLSQAAGGDVNVDPYDGLAVCAEDTAEEGTWKSYEVDLDAGVWSADKPSSVDNGGEALDCAMLVYEQANDVATDRYRNGDVFYDDNLSLKNIRVVSVI